MRRARALAIAAAAALLLSGPAARAQVAEMQSSGDAAPRPDVDSFRGSFHQSIRIEVPRFHDLEPDLALVYDSAAGNGWVGVGWGVSGSSQIARVSPGRGAARYADGDVFLLDGVELVADAGLGGTHREKFDRFRRISRDPASDAWTVVEKNGVRADYTALESTPRGTFRWALHTVTDRHGNRVTYDHSCGATGCYLDAISYNGAQVAFVRQARPDRITYATGASIGAMGERLARIEVRVGGSLARLVALDYATSPETGRSILTGVRQFGQDAQVGGDGSVTGTALPAHQLGHAGAAPTLAAAAVWRTESGPWRQDQAQLADVDGDGRLDAVHRRTDNTIWVALALASGDGFAAPSLWQSGLGGAYAVDQAYYRDVDGDGRADLLFRKSNNTIWVGRSTGTSFAAAASWASPGGAFAPGQAQYGDVDGDGRADLVFRSGGSFLVSRSTGTGFGASAVWATIADTGTAGADQTRLVDLDGDGKSDLTFRRSSDNTVWVALATGSGFAAPARWLALPGNFRAGQVQFGDFNGDGAADLAFRPVDCAVRTRTCYSCGNTCGPCGCAADEALVAQTGCSYANQSCGGGDNAEARMVTTSTCKRCTSTGEVEVALSTGAGFEPLVAWSSEAPTSYRPGQVRFADVNGDGRADLSVQSDSQELRVALSTGTGFAAAVLLATGSGAYDNDQVQYGDVNGDGRADLLFRGSDQTYRVSLALPADRPADALVQLDNPLGGRVEVAYRPSSAWPNLNGPPLLYTVTAITARDGRGSSSTTSFSYAGGKWSAPERRFLGFRRVVQVLDGAGTARETVYHQHARCQNQPEASWLRDGQGRIYSYESYVYDESGAAPYRSLLTERWHLECELGTSCRRRLTQFGYDEFGDLHEVREHGDFDAPGDETTTEIGYVANRGDFVVARPAYENVYVGLGAAPDRLRARTQHVRDGAALYTGAPSAGDETGTRAWDSTTGGYAAIARSFDQAGNPTAETDPVGATTTTGWDATYRAFPISRCDGLGHCSATEWDPALGRATRETDPNGQVTAFEHDPLGRPVRTTYPGGGTLTTGYVGFGDPGEQRIETVRSDGTPDGLWARTYVDGLGRTYLETREGDIARQTVYAPDVPSRVARRSDWFGPGESPRFDAFTSDGAGRVVRVLHADGSAATFSFAVGSERARDEAGHERTRVVDALGRVVAVRERVGDGEQETRYRHDALGHLVDIVDPAGHESTAIHDSLGRMERGCDPDRGCATYSYDAAGRVLARTDARGQITAWTYDLLGRPIGKSGGISWTYDEAGHGAGVGRVTSRRFPRGQDSLAYDFAG
ncbi:MAG TPA: FG-GAP-like repeat-containing protein, partial [Kofleriaceae bacterium]|nr:FG-GAP-like repeat-containing protein [Kofleriaceae bacterium]